jgi:ABC-type nitrate/sulfonate/bicarbonate transport system permease component
MKRVEQEKSLKEILRREGFKIALTAISLISFLAIWWSLSIYLNSLNLRYLPSPDAVFSAFLISISGDPVTGLPLMNHVLASLNRFVWGFALALTIAIPIGLLMGSSNYARYLGMPVSEILRPIPPLALAGFFFAAFGVVYGPIVTVFFGVFFPVLYNVMFGVRSVDPILMDAARTQGASRLQMFSKVILPFTIPYLMTGISIGMGVGWMVIVAAEWIAAPGGGVGALINQCYSVGIYDFMFVGIIAVAILGILTTSASRLLENKVAQWMGMK